MPSASKRTDSATKRTNIVLDERLVREAMRLSGSKTKRGVIDEALRTLVSLRKQSEVQALRGAGLIDPEYDHKAARAGRAR